MPASTRKAGSNVGDPPRRRDGQAVGRGAVAPGLVRGGRDRGGLTAPPGRRDSRLPVDQQHRPGRPHPVAAEAVEVDPGAHRCPGRIGGVPLRRVETGGLLAVDQGGNALSQEVEHLQPHVHRGRQPVGNHGRGIERVGVVGPQLEALRKGSAPGRGQGETARPVGGGRPRGGAQVGQVEQQYLRPGHRRARGQPDMALQKGVGSCRPEESESEQHDDGRSHVRDLQRDRRVKPAGREVETVGYGSEKTFACQGTTFVCPAESDERGLGGRSACSGSRRRLEGLQPAPARSRPYSCQGTPKFAQSRGHPDSRTPDGRRWVGPDRFFLPPEVRRGTGREGLQCTPGRAPAPTKGPSSKGAWL